MILFLFWSSPLTFYAVLIGQGQLFIFKWSDVSTMYGSKVVSVLNEPKKLSGAIAAWGRHQILSVWKEYKIL